MREAIEIMLYQPLILGNFIIITNKKRGQEILGI